MKTFFYDIVNLYKYALIALITRSIESRSEVTLEPDMAKEKDGPEMNVRKKKLEHAQVIMIYLMLYDAVAVTVSYFLALFLRFDLKFSFIPTIYYEPWLRFAPIYAVVCIGVFYALHLYRSIWRFASYTELARVIQATIITCTFHIIAITLFYQRMPISYYLMGGVFQFMFVCGIRFAYRFILLLRAKRGKSDVKNVMLIGAGAAGQLIQRDIKNTEEIHEKVVCIIDDNSNKWHRDT